MHQCSPTGLYLNRRHSHRRRSTPTEDPGCGGKLRTATSEGGCRASTRDSWLFERCFLGKRARNFQRRRFCSRLRIWSINCWEAIKGRLFLMGESRRNSNLKKTTKTLTIMRKSPIFKPFWRQNVPPARLWKTK